MREVLKNKAPKKAKHLTFTYRKNSQGTYLNCNKVFAYMAGLASPDEIIGKTDAELHWKEMPQNIHEGEISALNGFVTDVQNERLYLSTQKSVKVSLRFQRWDEDNSILATGFYDPSSETSPDIIKIGKKIDFTSRNHSNNEENEAKHLLKNIISKIPGSIYWKDRDGRFLGCNQIVAEMAGVASPDDVIGKTDADLIWKDKYKELRAVDMKVMKKNQLMQFEETVLLASGKEVTTLSMKSPLRNQKNEVIGIIGTSLDITELKETQRELEKEKLKAEYANNATKHLLENIISRMPGSIYWKDIDGKYIGCNQTMIEMAGVKNKSFIIGKTDADLIWKDKYEKLRKMDLEVMKKDQSMQFEETFLLANGEEVTTLSIKSPLYNQKKEIAGIINTSIDITELKSTQKQLEKAKSLAEVANQAKSNFISACGHELRTPLSFILGVVATLTEKVEENKFNYNDFKEFLPLMHQNAKSLSALIEDILSFSQLETGRCKVDVSHVSLRELLLSLYKETNLRKDKNNLSISFSYPEEIPSTVIGDPERIRQVYRNFINNAFKFTPPDGNIDIKVTLSSHSISNDPMIKISFSDTGIGISADKINKVWGHFQQVYYDESKERYNRYKGLGLGLAIVKELVLLMQGEVDVESILDKGTTFSFTLPIDN